MNFIRRTRKRAKDRGASESGAALVEFAILMPFLLLLILGTIEFAWLFSQNLDVRHGSREGARLVAVNYPVGPTNPSADPTDGAQTLLIVAEICSRMDVATDVEVTLQSISGGRVGDPATATVKSPVTTLTGFIDWAIPSGMELSSTVEIRIEQPAGWQPIADRACPGP